VERLLKAYRRIIVRRDDEEGWCMPLSVDMLRSYRDYQRLPTNAKEKSVKIHLPVDVVAADDRLRKNEVLDERARQQNPFFPFVLQSYMMWLLDKHKEHRGAMPHY
ncbi:hypothetical protein KIN20_013065, partial [Parelaphostrongylus tenuis]